MASSLNKLTKYTSAVTIVTADTANSWYGGLYGSSSGDALSETDPRNVGHVHDGYHLDGHAQKIDLVDHVTGQLRNLNLEDEAVDKRTVNKFEAQGSAIPEFEVIDGDTYYYLDLSELRDEIAAIAVGSPFELDSNIIKQSTTAGSVFGSDDFIIGSATLEYDSYANRLFFDVSKGAIRAGSATTEWNNASRGSYSAAFGENTTASGTASIAAGTDSVASGARSVAFGDESVASGIYSGVLSGTSSGAEGSASVIAGGSGNLILNSSSLYSGILSGRLNTIGDASFTGQYCFIGSGFSNVVATTSNAVHAAIVSGSSNGTQGTRSIIGAGSSNSITSGGINAAVAGGQSNAISAQSAGILAGNTNSVSGTESVIGGGLNNTVSMIDSGILSGQNNTVSSGTGGSVIGAGRHNTISSTGENNAILAGRRNKILAGSRNIIGAGGASNDPPSITLDDNEITSGNNSAILSGRGNSIDAAGECFIGAGYTNVIAYASGRYSSIVGGQYNLIDATSDANIIVGGGSGLTTGNAIRGFAGYSAIVGGADNTIFTLTGTTRSYNFIGGGESNNIASDTAHSVISGGDANIINIDYSEQCTGTIAGGRNNRISNVSNTASQIHNATIGGGTDNDIIGRYGPNLSSTVSGGDTNISDSAPYSSQGGGAGNVISSFFNNSNPNLSSRQDVSYSAIPGGRWNSCLYQGKYGTALGFNAVSHSYGMVSLSSGSEGVDEISYSDEDGYLAGGRSQTSFVTFTGSTGSSTSTNYYIYLNGVTATTSISSSSGYGLLLPAHQSVMLEWNAIARAEETGSAVTYGVKGVTMFDRLEAATAVQNVTGGELVNTGDTNTYATYYGDSGWQTNSGRITPIISTQGSPNYSIIFRVNTGTSSKGREASWTISCMATYVYKTI